LTPVGSHFLEFTADAFGSQPTVANTTQGVEQSLKSGFRPRRFSLSDEGLRALFFGQRSSEQPPQPAHLRDRISRRRTQPQKVLQVGPCSLVPVGGLFVFQLPVQCPQPDGIVPRG